MTAGSGKIIWILVADWSSVESSEPTNACDVTHKIGPLYFSDFSYQLHFEKYLSSSIDLMENLQLGVALSSIVYYLSTLIFVSSWHESLPHLLLCTFQAAAFVSKSPARILTGILNEFCCCLF